MHAAIRSTYIQKEYASRTSANHRDMVRGSRTRKNGHTITKLRKPQTKVKLIAGISLHRGHLLFRRSVLMLCCLLSSDLRIRMPNTFPRRISSPRHPRCMHMLDASMVPLRTDTIPLRVRRASPSPRPSDVRSTTQKPSPQTLP